MKSAKSTACLPDITLQDLGMLDASGALAAVDTFPWAVHLQAAETLDSAGKICVNPDLTFLIEPCHLTVKIQDNGSAFDIEVCIPRIKKILGIFGKVKFYTLSGLDINGVHQAIQTFFTEPAEMQHEYFKRNA